MKHHAQPKYARPVKRMYFTGDRGMPAPRYGRRTHRGEPRRYWLTEACRVFGCDLEKLIKNWIATFGAAMPKPTRAEVEHEAAIARAMKLGPRRQPQMLFSISDGIPFARLPSSPSGELRLADGEEFLSVAQAATATRKRQESLRQLWMRTWADVIKDDDADRLGLCSTIGATAMGRRWKR